MNILLRFNYKRRLRMMNVLDDMEFLSFVRQVLEGTIEHQEAILDVERRMFPNKQMDYELLKDIHRLRRWRDEIESYIVNKRSVKEMKMTMSDNSEFSETLGITLNYLKELLEKKNRDYGSNNLLTFGDLGILVRLSDKLERLKNYVLRDRTFEIDDENLEDTLYDIAGYAIMWIVLRKEGYELDDFRTLIEQ